MSPEQRLADLLDAKDEELEKARAEIEDLEQRLRGSVSGWILHRDLPEAQVLPVPRLEIELTRPEGYAIVWEYRMVMRHFLGHCVAVPLGHTTSTGATLRTWPPREEIRGIVRMQLPFRDGAHFNHDAKVLGWPAFILCDGVAESFVPWTVP